MSFSLHHEIERFRAFDGRGLPAGRIEMVGPDILKFTPAASAVSKRKIGFLGLVHGNEIVGLPLVNSLIEDLCLGRKPGSHELYFGLGNLPAAHKGQRFLEQDLNRCFGQSSTASSEACRAREIEEYMLNHVDYLIDFHQTVHPTLNPFFIFQYSSPLCFQHLSMMNPGLTTILQFDAIGDSQSLSTDEYLRGRGGFGTALELGQLGWSPEMFQLGRSIAHKFLAALDGPSRLSPANHSFFEISGKVTAMRDESKLSPLWQNFMRFDHGQVLGTSGNEVLLADRSGLMLFPRLGRQIDRGGDLFHVCQPLAHQKLRRLAGEREVSLVE